MYDFLDDIGLGNTYYGSSYYEVDKKRMAASKAAKHLHNIVSNEVKKEVARQEERFVNKVLDEIQVYFNSHTLEI